LYWHEANSGPGGGIARFGDGGKGGINIVGFDGGRSYQYFFDAEAVNTFEGALDVIDTGLAVHVVDLQV